MIKFKNLVVLFLVLLFMSCKDVTILSHFNSLGHSGYFYGNEIVKGVDKALNSNELKSCYKIKKLDIGSDLLTLRNNLKKEISSDSRKFFIGLGSSNKVYSIKNDLGSNLLFSPTATLNKLEGFENIILMSGINKSFSRQMSTELTSKNLRSVYILFDREDKYSIDLANSLKKDIGGKALLGDKVPTKAFDVIILLHNELNSLKYIKAIDNKKLSKVVFGADIWGPKTKYISNILSSLKNVKSIKRFYTYQDQKGFSSDIMYYSYKALFKLDEIIEKCKVLKSTCLNGINYVDRVVKSSELIKQ